MADNRSVNRCVILLALIACSHAILWAEGRHLKYKEKEEKAKHGSNKVNLHQNSSELKEDFQSTKPIVDIPGVENTASVTGKTEIFPPMRFGESAASDTDDFRPTAPGNSPGVSHKHAKEEIDVETKVIVDIPRSENTASATGKKEIFPPMSFGESAASDTDDFRPTAPGNSPGVGHKHAKEEEDVETKVLADIPRAENTASATGKKEIFPPMSFDESAASDTDDFRPTVPGHSPRVAHKHAKEEIDVETKAIVDIPRAENTASATGKKEIFPPMSFGESAASDTDDFRPTAPGNSPGVGHKHAKEEEDVETKVLADIPRAENTASATGKKEIFPPMRFGESAASDTDDFRPTAPGNSPGVGHKHAKEEEDVETKVIVDIFRAENTSSVTGKKEILPPMTFGESAPSEKDDFRPTAPGNSPGVGHKHAKEEDDVETKVVVSKTKA